jgi:hypothetical protein
MVDAIGGGLKLWVRHRGGGGPCSTQRAFGSDWPR